jgi:hypothetical protein
VTSATEERVTELIKEAWTKFTRYGGNDIVPPTLETNLIPNYATAKN